MAHNQFQRCSTWQVGRGRLNILEEGFEVGECGGVATMPFPEGRGFDGIFNNIAVTVSCLEIQIYIVGSLCIALAKYSSAFWNIFKR